MSNPTFSECFCARYNIPPEQFAREVFRMCIYRRTRLFKWLLPLINQNHFAADFDLIYGVERLTRMRDFVTEAERFNEHPANRGFLRRKLCLRVSTTRLKALIKETLPRKAAGASADLSVEKGSSTPFEVASATLVTGHQASTQYSS